MNRQGWIILILIALLLTNGFCFCLMALDKRRARKGKWRIPEKTLFLSAACFGALGGVMGMRLLRHKTKHRSFRIFFPALLAVQIVLLAAAAWLGL